MMQDRMMDGDRRRIALDAVDSTSSEAFRRADAGESGPLWVTALRQTGGRGRRGRAWYSPEGNLYASLLPARGGDDRRIHELCFVAGLAVHDILARLAPPSVDFAIKWPNDVLVNERKCAGILVESRSAGAGPRTTVIGIGINLRAHPHDSAFPATDLAAEGVDVGIEELLAALAPRLETRLEAWMRSDDFAPVAEEWLRHAYRLGRSVHLRGEDPSGDGIFTGLTAQGAMRIELPDGTERAIVAGDVVSTAEGRAA